MEFPEPKSLKEVVRVLGMAGYYRDFVKNMADIVEPLSRIRREGEPFEWTEECKVAFSTLKHSLTAPPVLIYPGWTKPFFIEADASDVAVGGTLSQQDSDDKVLKPIGYFSSSLDVHQRNYSAGERECWPIIAATRKWRTYCRAASKLNIITDHHPLKWLREQKDPRGKYARWILELEELPYEIQPRNGLDHIVPDCMSRADETRIDPDIGRDEEYLEQRCSKWQQAMRKHGCSVFERNKKATTRLALLSDNCLKMVKFEKEDSRGSGICISRRTS